MKDHNGTKQACSGSRLAAAGLLAFLAACADMPPATMPSAGGPIGAQFPLLSSTYPGLVNDPLIIVDETQPETVFYYGYTEHGYGYFPNSPYAPYGYFGYPYRYRPYGAYPRRPPLPRSPSAVVRPAPPGECGPGCGSEAYGFRSGGERSGSDMFAPRPGGFRSGTRARAVPQVGPQPPAVGPQPALVGPRPMPFTGWQGSPSRLR